MIGQPTPLTQAVGARLREIRQARGMTQHDIAAALGVSVPVVSALEDGVRISLDRLAEVAKAHGRPVADMLPPDAEALVSAEPATPACAPLLHGQALVDALVRAVLVFRAEHGRWPRKLDGEAGPLVGEPNQWVSWNACLRRGGRGTSLFCTLAEFCALVETGRLGE